MIEEHTKKRKRELEEAGSQENVGKEKRARIEETEESKNASPIPSKAIGNVESATSIKEISDILEIPCNTCKRWLAKLGGIKLRNLQVSSAKMIIQNLTIVQIKEKGPCLLPKKGRRELQRQLDKIAEIAKNSDKENAKKLMDELGNVERWIADQKKGKNFRGTPLLKIALYIAKRDNSFNCPPIDPSPSPTLNNPSMVISNETCLSYLNECDTLVKIKFLLNISSEQTINALTKILPLTDTRLKSESPHRLQDMPENNPKNKLHKIKTALTHITVSDIKALLSTEKYRKKHRKKHGKNATPTLSTLAKMEKLASEGSQPTVDTPPATRGAALLYIAAYLMSTKIQANLTSLSSSSSTPMPMPTTSPSLSSLSLDPPGAVGADASSQVSESSYSSICHSLGSLSSTSAPSLSMSTLPPLPRQPTSSGLQDSDTRTTPQLQPPAMSALSSLSTQSTSSNLQETTPVSLTGSPTFYKLKPNAQQFMQVDADNTKNSARSNFFADDSW